MSHHHDTPRLPIVPLIALFVLGALIGCMLGWALGYAAGITDCPLQ